MKNIIIEYTNMQGTVVYGIRWKILDKMYFRLYVGLLLLAGMYIYTMYAMKKVMRFISNNISIIYSIIIAI